MASELLKAQWLFAESLPRLIDHAVQLGYKVTLGEVYRSNEQAELNAIGFSGRAAVATLIEKQFPLLADFWEALGPTHRAGIRFGDTPHFSLEFNGAK